MNKYEYVIINRKKLQQRIEETEKEYSIVMNKYPLDKQFLDGRRTSFKEVLSNSIELIPEIEKAFDEAREYRMKNVFKHDEAIDYINQLKLDI